MEMNDHLQVLAEKSPGNIFRYPLNSRLDCLQTWFEHWGREHFDSAWNRIPIPGLPARTLVIVQPAKEFWRAVGISCARRGGTIPHSASWPAYRRRLIKASVERIIHPIRVEGCGCGKGSAGGEGRWSGGYSWEFFVLLHYYYRTELIVNEQILWRNFAMGVKSNDAIYMALIDTRKDKGRY
jgi:hypothetical protein